MKNPNIKWVYLVILSIIWGSSFILIKKSLLGVTAYQLGALRTILTGIILLAFGFKKLKGIPKPTWKWLIISGLLGSFIPAFFFAIAETEIDSAVTSILNSLVPLNTILLGFAVFKITSTKRQILGVVIGFIGTAILILKGAEQAEIAIFPVDDLAPVGTSISKIVITFVDALDGPDGKIFFFGDSDLLSGSADTNIDTDGDGHYNHCELDSDNDGIADIFESNEVAAINADTDNNGSISVAEAVAAGFTDTNLEEHGIN
jgi:drug/metabolite transporter (DMT)-like permease